MKKTLCIGLTGLWIVVATVLLAHWWLTSPTALSLPRLPESFLLPLMRWVGAQSAEDAMDVVELVTFTLSPIVVSLLTLLGWFLWCRIKSC